MKKKLLSALVLGAILLPARKGPADSFGFTLETRWSVPGAGKIRKLAFSPDGRWLAAVTGSQIRLFELTADKPPQSAGVVSTGRPEITDIAVSPDGKTIAAVDESGTLSLFEGAPLKELARVTRAHSGRASCVTFTGDGTYVVSGGRDGKLKVWTTRGEPFAELSRGAQHRGEILMVTGLEGGRRVLSIGRDRQAILWEIDTQQAIRPTGVGDDVRSAAIGGDGKTLALGLQFLTGNRFRSAPMGSLAHEIKAQDTLRLIDTQSGMQMRDIQGEEQDLDAVGVTPDGRFVAAGGSGRSASIWDTATGQRITTIPSDAPLSALAFAPDGKRMALGATDGSLSLYHLSGVGPVPRAKPKSDILIIVLGPSELVGIHRGEIPKVRTTTLDVRGEIRTAVPIKSLLVDGKEITSIRQEGSGKYLFDAYVPVTQPGERRFEIVAENAEGTTSQQSFVIERAADAPPRAPGGPGRRMALIIGISRYAEQSINLEYADQDARALYQKLTDPTLGPAAFRQDDVRLLVNEQATVSAINTGLRDFLQKAGENDFVLFFFAGHGAPDPNRMKDLYLLAYDTDPKNIAGTGLLMKHVRDAIAEIPARDVLILTDACHAAGMAGADGTRAIAENPINQEFLERMRHASASLAILTASEAAQFSYENPKWNKHGAFTYFLLQGMQGEADYDHDGIVSLGELIEYVRDQVRAATDFKQIPGVGNTSFDRQMPLTIVVPKSSKKSSNPHSSWR